MKIEIELTAKLTGQLSLAILSWAGAVNAVPVKART